MRSRRLLVVRYLLSTSRPWRIANELRCEATLVYKLMLKLMPSISASGGSSVQLRSTILATRWGLAFELAADNLQFFFACGRFDDHGGKAEFEVGVVALQRRINPLRAAFKEDPAQLRNAYKNDVLLSVRSNCWK